jgi:hypothetical protein
MNALKISVFTLLLSGMYLTSCQKNQDQVADTPANSSKAPDQNSIKIKEPEKLFERSVKVFDAAKTKSATLRLRASSQQTLDRMNLQDMEFTLVNTPANLQQQASPGTSLKQGAALASKQGATRNVKSAEDLKIPDNAIVMDFPDAAANAPVSIEVSSKAKADKVTADPGAQSLSYAYLYLYGSNWHRVQVTNLGYNPIYSSFYYHYWGSKYYSGYAYTLRQNGWSYYYNCSYAVGVNLTFYGAYRYRYTWWANC